MTRDKTLQAARLAMELGSMADRVNDEAVATFVNGAVFSAAQRLLEALEVMTEAAAADRDLSEPTL